MADPIDLASLSFVQAQLAAGGMTLSTAQTTALPSLITAASGEIQRICRRLFNVNTYDEIQAPYRGQPDKGEPDWVDLSCLPVVVGSVTRCASGRTTALTVANTSTANQRALVEFTATGDPDVCVTRTGLKLTRVASGTTTTNTLTFASYPTVSALAAAVTALGNGWTATASTTLALWPSVDLYGSLGPLSATGTGCSLDLFGLDLAGYSIDHRRGAVYLPSLRGTRGVTDWAWGTAAEDETLTGAAGWRGAVRVTYQAGFATVPLVIQEACAEAVKAALYRLKTDDALQSESAKDYSYTLRQVVPGLPDGVRQAIHSYRLV